MISSDKKIVQILVEECIKAGVSKVVCSPGSRNAPLVIAMDEHPQIDCLIIHDERSAAFVAMGMSQQLKEPVAVLCTSGSAMLNYYPAVAEAYYQRIPLVVLSADRPQKWINQGDGQTIVQTGVYNNHIDGEILLEEGQSEEDVRASLKELFRIANGLSKGPVHVNIALDEPLYNTVEIANTTIEKDVAQYKNKILTEEEVSLISSGHQQPSKMILIGQMSNDIGLYNRLLDVADDPSVAILVENTSNLVSQKWIHCIDRTLNLIPIEELGNYSPDLLITMGGAIVSKRIKKFLRSNAPKMHWNVGCDFPEMDTYECLTHSFPLSESYFLEVWLKDKPEMASSNFGSKWKQMDFKAQDKAKDFLMSCTYSDLGVFETILDFIPDNSHLHMANSSVVRYCQLFDPIKGVHYWSNRGTSGIDGSTSTAVGAALAKPADFHTIITGDVSFFYDSNALWNNYLLPNLRVILINNDGGGIFNIIPGPGKTEQNNQFFRAKHNFSAKYICKAFNVEYCEAKSIEDIESQMHDFYTYSENDKCKLMEINTSDVENHLVLEDYFNTIKQS